MIYESFNVPESCYLCVHCISTCPKCQDPRNIIKSPHKSHKVSIALINTPNPLTTITGHLRILTYTSGAPLMSVAYHQAQKQRYRVTLELDVMSDFDPHQLDWEKLFKLEPAEKCDAYVEDLSTPDRW